MTYLLDVSLLIALLDAEHVHHELAIDWFDRRGEQNWATCPITENGLLRILTNAAYPRLLGPPSWVLEVFREFCGRANHLFWADDLSFLDIELIPSSAAVPSAHVTDLYLLALAIRHGGQFATLDRRVPAHLITNGGASLLVVG